MLFVIEIKSEETKRTNVVILLSCSCFDSFLAVFKTLHFQLHVSAKLPAPGADQYFCQLCEASPPVRA